MLANLHQHTPTLCVIDPRGLSVRTLAYHCATTRGAISERIQRQVFNALGQLSQQWDPRRVELSQREADVQPNLSTTYSLSGQVLHTHSVDAGWKSPAMTVPGCCVKPGTAAKPTSVMSTMG